MMLGRAPWARRTATASVVLYGQRSSSYSSSSEDLDGAAARIARARRVVAFTGAGLSAESGIPTYRAALEAQGRGLWDGFRGALALAFFGTKIGWLVAPSYAWALYVDRLLGPISRAEPNAAHAALADLDACLAAGVPVITQNVDGLCQRAGARDVIEVHGTVLTYRHAWTGASLGPAVGGTGSPGAFARPDVVFFGEALGAAYFRAEDVVEALGDGDVMIVVGCSCAVAPAGLLPYKSMLQGAHVIEVNLRKELATSFQRTIPSPDDAFGPAAALPVGRPVDLDGRQTFLRGSAASVLPALVAAVRAKTKDGS